MGKNIKSFKIFESSDNDEVLNELMDNLANINDVLGDPQIDKKRYTGSTFTYTFIWKLDFNITSNNDIDKLVEFNRVMKEIIDISATKQRMENFDFKVSISNMIALSVYPKVKSENQTYNFILKQEWREIQIDTVDVVRFFRDNGVNVLDIYEEYEEVSELGSLKIELDSDTHTNEFVRIFNKEFDEKARLKVIDRNIEASGRGKNIEIYPIDEKTYVVEG